MQWEYFDRMVVFAETPEGMVSGLETWINGAGSDGWELVSSTPLIAPNKEGVAYGTIGVHLIFKRPCTGALEVSIGRFVVRYYDGEDQRIVAHEFDAGFRFLGEIRAHVAEWIGEDDYFEWSRLLHVRCPADL